MSCNSTPDSIDRHARKTVFKNPRYRHVDGAVVIAKQSCDLYVVCDRIDTFILLKSIAQV